MTLEAQKLTLLSKILSINNQSELRLINEAVQEIENKRSHSLDDISFYIGNIEPKVSVEKLQEEQNVAPLLMSELEELIEKADFTENIDELLLTIK
jgi:hypothetical protein